MKILSKILDILTGGATSTGGAVANVVGYSALIAALTPGAVWLLTHKNEIFLCHTYGELAFWSAIIGGMFFVVMKLAYHSPAPRRGDFE